MIVLFLFYYSLLSSYFTGVKPGALQTVNLLSSISSPELSSHPG